MVSTLFQTSLGTWALLSGVFLCIVYDVFRVFRIRRSPKAFVLFISDFAFCLLATVAMLVLFFNFSYGKVRVYAVGVMVAGFLLWRFTLGKVICLLMSKGIDVIAKAVDTIKRKCKLAVVRLARNIKTKNYCRCMVKKSRNGFGIITERNKK